ncbi:SIS domain-containing protein [Stappia stellulata]|uniref:SIS domain-containing protein n=1 Tax=Stappia stellulata TaxID=71235 RepID=UPI0004127508|nr:SIS domain-containing protein [Stappia stellulata]
MTGSATTQLRQETGEIPDRVAAQIADRRDAFAQAGAVLRRHDPQMLVTVARGSSDHAATYLKYLCEMTAGRPVASVGPSIASVYARNLQLTGAACISISQSGKSPDLIAFQDMARRARALTLALVNTSPSPLANGADTAIDIGAGPEHAVAASKSYVCSLSAMAGLVGAWTQSEALTTALAHTPDRLRAALSCDWSALVPAASTARSLYVIGRGPGFAIAQEAALKFKETCQIHAESYSSAEVMHGPIQLAANGLVALVFLSRDEARAGLLEAAARLAASGAQVFVADPLGEEQGQAITPLPCVAAAAPLLDPLCQITSFYRFIEHLAGALGFDPDAPQLLNKVTETL